MPTKKPARARTPARKMPRRLTYAEFEQMLRDPTVRDADLRPYFVPDPARSRPFRPALRIDRKRVSMTPVEDIRAEGAFAMDWANDLARWRRHLVFRARRPTEQLPLLVSEGDSWFQFPIFLDDVIDQLEPAYLVWSIDAAGDTLKNMVETHPEYPEALAAFAGDAKAFLFSGAGNDLVGEDDQGVVLTRVLKDHSPGQPAEWYIDTDAYRTTISFIEHAYRKVLERVRQDHPALPVLLHGYDYAIPGPAPNEWRHPTWARVDQWLGSAMHAKGIADHPLQCEIIRLMIDDLNTRQRKLCGGNVRGGEFRKVYHVDVRGTLARKEWADELHPTDGGFAKVARKVRTVLKEAGV